MHPSFSPRLRPQRQRRQRPNALATRPLPLRPHPPKQQHRQGYAEAARAFERESGTAPGLDLGAITERMEIRKAMAAGDVEGAIERVNDLDPEARWGWVCGVLRVFQGFAGLKGCCWGSGGADKGLGGVGRRVLGAA